jgi:hypothetical protein
MNNGLYLFIEQYLLSGIFLFFALLIYDLVIMGLENLVFMAYRNNKRKLIYMPGLLVKFYHLYDFLFRILHRIRLNWIKQGYSRDNYSDYKLYYIINGGITTSIFKIFVYFYLLSRYAVINLVITYFIVYKPVIDVKQSIGKIINHGSSIYNNLITMYTINEKTINKITDILPSVLVLLSVFITSIYIFRKNQLKEAVNKSHEEYLMGIINTHRELKKLISKIIFKGSKNINRALEIIDNHEKHYAIKDLIVRYRMENISRHISEINENEVKWDGISYKSYFLNKDDIIPYGFSDIQEISIIINLLNDLKKNDKYFELLKLCQLNKSVYHINSIVGLSENDLNELLFTHKGIKNLIKEANENFYLYEELNSELYKKEKTGVYGKEVLKEQSRFRKLIDDNIIKGIELLIELSKYEKSMIKILKQKPDNMGDLLKSIIDTSLGLIKK